MPKEYRLKAFVLLLAVHTGAFFPLFSFFHDRHHLEEYQAFEKAHALICDGPDQVSQFQVEHQHFFHIDCETCAAQHCQRFALAMALVRPSIFDGPPSQNASPFASAALPPVEFRLPPACGPPIA